MNSYVEKVRDHGPWGRLWFEEVLWGWFQQEAEKEAEEERVQTGKDVLLTLHVEDGFDWLFEEQLDGLDTLVQDVITDEVFYEMSVTFLFQAEAQDIGQNLLDCLKLLSLASRDLHDQSLNKGFLDEANKDSLSMLIN